MSVLARVLAVSVLSVCFFHSVRGVAAVDPLISECSTKPADMVFLLDSSGSVGAANFNTVKEFLKHFVQSLEIGPMNFNVGVVTFATDVNNAFWLNTHTTKSSLLEAIDNISYNEGRTKTDSGLACVRKEAFTKAHGDRGDANNILVVITDGKSSYPTSTAKEANKLHKTDTKIIAVGIGNADQNELKTIASDVDSVFAVRYFRDLTSIEERLKTIVCEAAVAPVNECRILSGDIVFLLDSSGSIGPGNFNKVKEYVKHMAKSLTIGPNTVNIGVVTFDMKIHDEFWLRNYTTESSLLEAIDRIPYYDGTTKTGMALSYARQHAFSEAHGDRDFPDNILIVITDGQSDNPRNTHEEAGELHKSDVTVLSIGVGKYADESELEIIADGKENVFDVTDSSVLDTVKDKLSKAACKAAPSGSRRAVAAARRYVP